MRTKSKNPYRFVMYFFCLVLLIIFGGFAYFNHLRSPLSSQGQIRAFVVQKNESVSSVAKRLEEEKFIRSSLMFKYLYDSKKANIEAGDFKLSSSMSVEEILKQLEKGSIDKWVTFPEGIRVEQMAKILNQEIGVSEEEFLKHAKEGYMFPDTYLFNPNANVSDLTNIMRKTFEKRLDSTITAKLKANGISEEQAVILASLVEREGRSDKVREEVAGIMLKRLNMGMKLDIDATVQYAKDTQILKSGKSLEKFWLPITQEEYASVVSPYNTYLNPGLPPTPICNPSLSSLKAVANANSKTPYLFYYHDSQGNSYYGKTLEEHNKNVANHR